MQYRLAFLWQGLRMNNSTLNYYGNWAWVGFEIVPPGIHTCMKPQIPWSSNVTFSLTKVRSTQNYKCLMKQFFFSPRSINSYSHEAIDSLKLQCQELKSLSQAAEVEREKLMELVSVLQKRWDGLIETAPSKPQIYLRNEKKAWDGDMNFRVKSHLKSIREN